MSVSLETLVQECNLLLRPDDFRDYCPNGLQVEGSATVNSLVSGVTASQDFLQAAIKQGADAVLVHHGYFWQGENPQISGIKKQRIRTLLENDISLLAYHLPLDAHPQIGNNIQLGKQLGFTVEDELFPRHKSKVGVTGRLEEPCSAEVLCERIEQVLQRRPLHVPGRTEKINTIAWCTGSAQHFIEQAHELGADAYLSGEVSEQTVHFARESGIHFFAAGHHATERYGVQALGSYLAEKFDLQHQFIDIDNPV
ncbi:MAG: Nif3-like dinuclear metal center hexameric protein [Gammaproteobacteria bacterium]|nr:Nif3-like dinuclear metal center hexameric protein [Gammaproteobacteria bacterium]